MAQDLFKLALAAADKAHSPYSDFPVGAAIRTSDGRLYSGCNVENASYPEGWCAETSAIAHMVMDGGGIIEQVALLGLKADLCTPCGGCRQRLAEFSTPQTLIFLCNLNGIEKTIPLGELLPMGFSLEKN